MNRASSRIARKRKSAYLVAWKFTDGKIEVKCGDRFVAGSSRLNQYKNSKDKTLFLKLGFQFSDPIENDYYKDLNQEELDFLPQKLTKLIKYKNKQEDVKVPSPGKMAQRWTLDKHGKQVGATEGYMLQDEPAVKNFVSLTGKFYTDHPDLLKDLQEGKTAPEFIIKDEATYMLWVDLALRDSSLAYLRLKECQKVGPPLKRFIELGNKTLTQAFDEWKLSESRKVEDDFRDAGLLLVSPGSTSQPLGEILDIFDYPPFDSETAYNEVRDLLGDLEPKKGS